MWGTLIKLERSMRKSTSGAIELSGSRGAVLAEGKSDLVELGSGECRRDKNEC